MGPAPELWPPGARGAPRRTAQRAQSCCCTTSSMTEDRTVKRVCWELSPRLPALQRERLSFPCSYFSHVVLARLARPLRPWSASQRPLAWQGTADFIVTLAGQKSPVVSVGQAPRHQRGEIANVIRSTRWTE